jgi:hypothetical protein
VRFQARTGWELEERTKVRYQNAKESEAIEAISSYLAGYELEEIGHEEDALKVLRGLEAEGWMKHLFPVWTAAKADIAGLEALHQTLIQLLIQGIHPDLSAAQMELLTAKMQPKDLAALKKRFPRHGFVEYWERLEESAKEFQKELLDKKSASPSATWKLLTSYPPEPVLWLAYTSKNSQVQTKFRNFFTVWPEARQKIPTALMLEMRIVPELPGYQDLVQEIFYQLMDGKLTTDEEMRAFLEPHSPPAPPPPVKIGRSRGKRGEAKLRLREEEEEEEEEDLPVPGLDEEQGELGEVEAESESEEEEEEEAEVVPVPKVKAKPAKAAPAKPEAAVKVETKPAKAAPEPKGSAVGKKPAAKVEAPVPAKKAAAHVTKAPAVKKATSAKSSARTPKAPVKAAKTAPRPKPVKKPIKKAAPKPKAVKKPAAKPVKKKR